MWAYLQRHERFIREVLEADDGRDLALIQDFHRRQIRFMQHERLIHLIVTMFVCLFFLLTVGYGVLRPSWGVAALAGLLLILTAAYLVHYFRLENGVQRWYELARRLDERIAGVPLTSPPPAR